MKVKHSKYKNTGVLFELCVRQIATDLLNNKDSKAIDIVKKYFSKGELANEYALYNIVASSPKTNSDKSDILINTILEQHKKLDYRKLNSLKYNLIKEIKSSYDIDDFFKAKIKNYKVHAALYTLFEIEHSNKAQSTSQIISNKITLKEHLTAKEEEKPFSIADDLIKEDKEIRILTYKILVDKFNDKYSSMNDRQKNILREYVSSTTSTESLKKFINEEIKYVKGKLEDFIKNSSDKVMVIKIKEVNKLVNPLKENESIKDELITGLLQYHELIEELAKENK